MAREKLIQFRQGTRAELNASTAHWYPGEPGYIEDERAFIVADRDGPTDEQNFAVFREPTKSLVGYHTSIHQPGPEAFFGINSIEVFPPPGGAAMPNQLEPGERLIIEGMFVFEGDDETPELTLHTDGHSVTLIPDGFFHENVRFPAHLRMVIQPTDAAIVGVGWVMYVGQVTQPNGNIIGFSGAHPLALSDGMILKLSRSADPLDRPLQATIHAWLEKCGQ